MALSKYAEKINEGYMDPEDRYEKVFLDEIPIMISDHLEVVCIPKNEEVFASAILGQSGFGKSLLFNRLSMSLKAQWDANVALMNDVSDESLYWSEPMQHKHFNKVNRLYVNQEPYASDLVYLFPNTNNLEIVNSKIKDKTFVKTVLPFSEIIQNLTFFLEGVMEDFDLGKSGNYIKDIEEELMQCQSVPEVVECLEQNLPGADGKSFQAMRAKIFNAFRNLMKEKILDITNPECHAYLKLKKEGEKTFIGNPISTVMKSGSIPSFITSHLQTKSYKNHIFSYYINDIFKNNLKHFPGEKTFLCFDELATVCQKESEPSAKALGDVAARGRINNVGLIYATQFYNKIPNSVKGAKLNYAFAFRHNNSKIINEIAGDFDLDKKDKEKIKGLKKYECLAMTNDKFVCYFEGVRYTRTGPIKGRILFPFSNHLKASANNAGGELNEE